MYSEPHEVVNKQHTKTDRQTNRQTETQRKGYRGRNRGKGVSSTKPRQFGNTRIEGGKVLWSKTYQHSCIFLENALSCERRALFFREIEVETRTARGC